jgi:DNA-binding winged helix-turn-helix (wHTH) protein
MRYVTPIGDDGERQTLIRTLARKGFRFVGEVQEQREEEMPSAREEAKDDLAADR